jgi:RHS repeat-associated protein
LDSSTSLITNLDGEVVQHVEYVPFGEVFIEERNNTWNTPYLFNAKELDEETGLYYYGARYYDSRTSAWLSVDPIATYNPFEKENFIDGQHHGGIYNSFNHAVYSYCYQNPTRLVDPNGKQADFSNFMGMSPEQWRSQVIQNETAKLEAHAAMPSAISIPISASLFGIGITEYSITPTWILKGPDQGFHLYLSASIGLNVDSGNGGNVGFMTYWLKGDERNLRAESFTGNSTDFTLGYKNLSVDYSTFDTGKGDKMEGFGLSLSSPKFGPKKLEFLNSSISGSKTYTIDVIKILSKENSNKDNQQESNESTNHYYLRTYTNLPQDWYENN